MAVTSASEGGIFRAASGIMLNRDARPVVHGVGEPVMASLSSYHYAAFARPLGDRRDPCQTAQGGVISSLQSIEGFSEQRGKDDPSHSRQGVMLLPLSQPGLLRRNEPGSEGIKLAMRLPVDCDGRHFRDAPEAFVRAVSCLPSELTSSSVSIPLPCAKPLGRHCSSEAPMAMCARAAGHRSVDPG